MPDYRALITGILGFCGGHLRRHLAEQGYAVCGIDQRADLTDQRVPVYSADIRDTAAIRDILLMARPTHIFHLAALTTPQADWETLFDVNVRGTGHLLDAVRLADLDPVVLIAGSSAAYGYVAMDELPISELQPFRPTNVYAASKIAQEMLAYTYYARYRLKLIRARAFNLTGPGEGPGFAASAFAAQIAEIESGKREPVLRVGSLEAVRDFTDVRDAVHAYRLLAEQGEPGAVYNVCSERGTAIRYLLDRLLALSLVSDITVQRDPVRLQPADVPVQVGDATRLRQTTGWTPAIPLEQTLQDVLDSWRRRSDKE